MRTQFRIILTSDFMNLQEDVPEKFAIENIVVLRIDCQYEAPMRMSCYLYRRKAKVGSCPHKITYNPCAFKSDIRNAHASRWGSRTSFCRKEVERRRQCQVDFWLKRSFHTVGGSYIRISPTSPPPPPSLPLTVPYTSLPPGLAVRSHRRRRHPVTCWVHFHRAKGVLLLFLTFPPTWKRFSLCTSIH